MSNVPAFVERLRIIAKALREKQPHAKERAIMALICAADYIETRKMPEPVANCSSFVPEAPDSMNQQGELS